MLRINALSSHRKSINCSSTENSIAEILHKEFFMKSPGIVIGPVCTMELARRSFWDAIIRQKMPSMLIKQLKKLLFAKWQKNTRDVYLLNYIQP